MTDHTSKDSTTRWDARASWSAARRIFWSMLRQATRAMDALDPNATAQEIEQVVRS